MDGSRVLHSTCTVAVGATKCGQSAVVEVLSWGRLRKIDVEYCCCRIDSDVGGVVVSHKLGPLSLQV